MTTKRINVFGICSSLERRYGLGARDTLILLHLKLLTSLADLDPLKEVSRMLSGFISYPTEKRNPWALPTLATSWEDSKAKRWAAVILNFYLDNYGEVVNLFEKETEVDLEKFIEENLL